MSPSVGHGRHPVSPEDVRIQVALTAMVAVLIALNIFLILMFAYPFSGDLRVSPDSFRVAMAIVPMDSPSASR